jgi:hypothetical protein
MIFDAFRLAPKFYHHGRIVADSKDNTGEREKALK